MVLGRTYLIQPAGPLAVVGRPTGAVAVPTRVAATGTVQRFDAPGVGTPFAVGTRGGAPARAPQLIVGGPTGAGHAIRLALEAPVPTLNSLAFDRSDAGSFDQTVVDFDFRIAPGRGRADGLGVALLNTSAFGATGEVAPQAPFFAANEPSFKGSIGVGFDVSRPGDSPTEPGRNRVAVYFDGKPVRAVDLGKALDVASGEWTHARIVVRPRRFSDITVTLAGCGRTGTTVVDHLAISGLAPYESRLYVAAGGQSTNQDVDNIRVQELDAAQAIPPFTSTCRSMVTNTFDDAAAIPYSAGVHAAQPTLAPQVTPGGPTGIGNMLRLAFGRSPADDRNVTTASHNSITFDRPDAAETDQIVADFDMRIRPGVGRGDGLGFALLNTASYGTSGPVAPLGVAEEPNFAGSLGIGFDVLRSTDLTEINSNHVSVHFDGKLLREFDVTPALDLGGSEWVHVRILMRPGGGFSDVSVELTQCGRPTSTIVDRFPISGFLPYSSRPHFAARAVDGQADHDIDNVRVTYLGLDQSVVSFDAVCHRALETAGSQVVNVTRTGASAGPTTVRYSTADGTAAAGKDYVAASGALQFAAGETTKSISLKLLDDNVEQGDRMFLVKLTDASGATVVAGPATTSVTIVDDERAGRLGSWGEAIPSEIVPINMSLLPTGDILYWDRHDHVQNWDGQPRVLNLATYAITKTAALAYDLFCSGHALLVDGRLLAVGGHVADFDGEPKASIYDPVSGTWTRVPDMNAGRWYPTAVTLPSGDVLVMGGTYIPAGKTQPQIDTLPQVWQAATNTWRDLTTARQGWVPDWSDYYPFLYVAPNGRVFDAGPHGPARYLDTSGTGSWTFVANSRLPYRDYGSSVMYEPGKVMISGGNRRDERGQPVLLPEASVEVIDLNEPNPAWRSIAPMHVGRRQHNTTLLPDGRVLVTGGSSATGFDNPAGAVYGAEIWDPATETWTEMASESHYRGYHSSALLLPDGRVLVGGGGHPDSTVGAQLNFEIYSPPYLFRGTRPRVGAAPAEVSYGRTFSVETPDAASIAAVNWIRLGAVTHAFNSGQHINHLPFSRTATGLQVAPPADPNLAPPGDYMLFLINRDGVPSVAHFIRVEHGASG
jgi:hypothetical protein